MRRTDRGRWCDEPREPQSHLIDEFGRMRRDDNAIRSDWRRRDGRGRYYQARWSPPDNWEKYELDRQEERSRTENSEYPRRSTWETRNYESNSQERRPCSPPPKTSTSRETKTEKPTAVAIDTQSKEVPPEFTVSSQSKVFTPSLYPGISENNLLRGINVLGSLLTHINYFNLDNLSQSGHPTEWQLLAVQIIAPLWGETTWSEIIKVLLVHFHPRRSRQRIMHTQERNLSKELEKYVKVNEL